MFSIRQLIQYISEDLMRSYKKFEYILFEDSLVWKCTKFRNDDISFFKIINMENWLVQDILTDHESQISTLGKIPFLQSRIKEISLFVIINIPKDIIVLTSEGYNVSFADYS